MDYFYNYKKTSTYLQLMRDIKAGKEIDIIQMDKLFKPDNIIDIVEDALFAQIGDRLYESWIHYKI